MINLKIGNSVEIEIMNDVYIYYDKSQGKTSYISWEDLTEKQKENIRELKNNLYEMALNGIEITQH